MDKKTAKQIVTMWNTLYANSTAETATTASIEESHRKGMYEVAIKPTDFNDGCTFYHLQDVAVVTNAFRVACIVTQDSENKLYALIF